jgi:uncharacterized protein
MRHLTRDKGRAELLLERARTIAVVGPPSSERTQATVNYLRRVGYDVVPVPSGGLANVPGAIDLVLVFRAPDDLQGLLDAAAAKRVDGVWFTQQAAGRLASSLARRLGLTVIVEGDIARLHRERQRAAGSPPKLSAIARRRGRTGLAGDDPSVATGWKEAGGGGSQGGGGGRAALDEKKMRRS